VKQLIHDEIPGSNLDYKFS